MPNITNNIGLYTYLENEVVDFEQINTNFEKIDELVSCIESGVKSAEYSGGSVGTANWNYKKYTDGTVEMYTGIDVTSLKCNGGTEALYYSSEALVAFPFKINIKNIQTHLSSSVVNFVTDDGEMIAKNNVSFKLHSYTKETSTVSKRLFIYVRGVISNG